MSATSASEALEAPAYATSASEVLGASTSPSVASAIEGALTSLGSRALASWGIGASSPACFVAASVASPWATGSFGSALADAAPRCKAACASTTHRAEELVLTLSALSGARAGASA